MFMPVEIFCCYARKDKSLLNEIRIHLMPLQRQGHITLWADTEIDAGTEWEEEINKPLNTAQIILLLVSSDFIASEYCYSKEMTRAMERHKAGEAQVVPIILRPVLWRNAPFGILQALPTDARPVIGSTWHNQDEALLDVANGIQKVVQRFLQREEEQKELPPTADLDTYFTAKAIPTGFEDFDRLTGGLQRSDLIVVEAPPATGKTSFALSVALNVAINYGHSVGIFSLEMSRERLIQRLISMDASIDLQRLFKGTLKDEELENLVYAMDRIFEGSILCDDCASLTISQLRTRAQEMMHNGNVDLIIIDYVDLIRTEGTQGEYENKGRDFREISRCLKIMARELNVPVLALVQISRTVVWRPTVEVKVSKDQGIYIENDADIVMYIYCEDMYDRATERLNIVDLIVTKHRNGPLGVISLYFDRRTGRFRDLMMNPQQYQSNVAE
jgi:replicative DNA helicase